MYRIVQLPQCSKHVLGTLDTVKLSLVRGAILADVWNAARLAIGCMCLTAQQLGCIVWWMVRVQLPTSDGHLN